MYHIGCGQKVFANINSAFNLMAEVNRVPGSPTLSTVRIHLFQQKHMLSFSGFYCMACDKDLTLEEIGFSCRHCGKKLGIADTFVPMDSNGSFCKDCCDNSYPEEEHIPMTDLLNVSRISIT